jgi:rubredoxin
MEKYICSMCGWEYDPEKGFPVFQAKPGTPFEKLPDDFCCPVCGADKSNFMPRTPRYRGGAGGSAQGRRSEAGSDAG